MIKKDQKMERKCDFPGCEECGSFKAPKNRLLNDYYWFCLNHVKEYNKNWNFYQGLSSEEIEQHIQNDTTWQRPTWRLGQFKTYGTGQMRDGFGLFEDLGLGMDGKHNPPQAQIPVHSRLAEAVEFMELSFPLKLSEVKKKYKQLAKKYHPDTNAGDKEAEKMFKKLHDHYKYILKQLGEK